MKKEKRTRRLYTEEEKRVHIKQYRMSGLTAYGYSKITGVNRATLRSWLKRCPGNDLDMVSCSFNHEEEIFMKKGKNSIANSDLSATVYASADIDTGMGASNPGDLSSPHNEFNTVWETASVSDVTGSPRPIATIVFASTNSLQKEWCQETPTSFGSATSPILPCKEMIAATST